MAQGNYRGSAIAGINTRAIMYVMLILGGLLIALVASQFGFIAGLGLAVVPLFIVLIFSLVASPHFSLLMIFAANYFIMGTVRYTDIPGGPIMDVLLGMTIVGMIIQACQGKLDMGNSLNSLSLLSGVWLLYCIFEIFNLNKPSFEAWLQSGRGLALYFFLLSIVTPVIFTRYRDVKRVLILWSMFTIVGAGKAVQQKIMGFDHYELRWLYELDAQSTHLISSGIRYFSIFTDAANFGALMGFSMVMFTVCAFMSQKWLSRIYFIAVAILSFYAMMLSGTRGANAVPFAGFGLFVLLSRNWKVVIPLSFFLAFSFWFLNFTTHLEGNTYVRRMRSTFDTNDASLQVRFDNQAKMKVWLRDHPFGAGIGMGGGKAKKHDPNAYMSQLPTDSWFVLIWAETGIVGLSLYITILVILLIRCSYVIMFRIKNKQLRGILGGMLSGVFGVMIASIGNEIMGQFPNGFIVYTMLAFIYMGEKYDQQLSLEEESGKLPENGWL